MSIKSVRTHLFGLHTNYNYYVYCGANYLLLVLLVVLTSSFSFVTRSHCLTPPPPSIFLLPAALLQLATVHPRQTRFFYRFETKFIVLKQHQHQKRVHLAQLTQPCAITTSAPCTVHRSRKSFASNTIDFRYLLVGRWKSASNTRTKCNWPVVLF